MRILVVDDDKFFLRIITDILTGAGHEVIQATDGEEAIEKALNQQPDLAIVDVILPKLLGTEVSRKLRNYSRTGSIPILLISTGVAEIEKAAGDPKEFLADDFIHKPFRPEKLLDRVDRLIRIREQIAERGADRPPRPSPGVERRRHPRLPLDVEVSARTAKAILYHPMINISSGGVYLEVERPLRTGTEVDLCFVIPGEVGMISTGGQVAWCVEMEEGSRWAAGVRFVDLKPEYLERIERYTRSLLKVVRPNGVEREE